jgi:hypothetical protein
MESQKKKPGRPRRSFEDNIKNVSYGNTVAEYGCIKFKTEDQ